MDTKESDKKGLINLGALSIQSVIAKAFSFLKEMILLYVFGNTKTLAFYIFLRSFTSGITMFSGSNILLANLLPRFSKIYSSNINVSLNSSRKTAAKISITIFLIVCLTLITVTFFTYEKYQIDVSTSFFLVLAMAISSAVLFYTLVGLVLLQAKGEYIRFSYASITNHLTTLILIYPLSLISIVFSEVARLIGLISQYQYIWNDTIRDKAKEIAEPQIGFKDFEIKKIINANYITFIALITNIQLGFFFEDVVVSFNYAHLMYNAVFTIFTMNVAALLLRNISIETSNQNIKVILSIIVKIIVFGIMYFSLENIFNKIFIYFDLDIEKMNMFYDIFYALFIPYLINYVGYVLYQNAFVKESKIISICQYINIFNVLLYLSLMMVLSFMGYTPLFIITISMSAVSVIYLILSIVIYTR